MKHHQTPQLRAGAVLIAIFIIFIFLLNSCTPEKIPYNRHGLIITPGNEETYLFADWDSGKDWQELNNGDKYSFELNCKNVTVKATKTPKKVQYHRDAMDRKPKELEVVNNTFQTELTENGSFVIMF